MGADAFYPDFWGGKKGAIIVVFSWKSSKIFDLFESNIWIGDPWCLFTCQNLTLFAGIFFKRNNKKEKIYFGGMATQPFIYFIRMIHQKAHGGQWKMGTASYYICIHIVWNDTAHRSLDLLFFFYFAFKLSHNFLKSWFSLNTKKGSRQQLNWENWVLFWLTIGFKKKKKIN